VHDKDTTYDSWHQLYNCVNTLPHHYDINITSNLRDPIVYCKPPSQGSVFIYVVVKVPIPENEPWKLLPYECSKRME